MPKWEGHVQPLKPLWGYENEADPKVVEKKFEQTLRRATGGGGNGDLIGANQNVWGGGLGKI